MINAWNLIWIIPLSIFLGIALLICLACIYVKRNPNEDEYFKIEVK